MSAAVADYTPIMVADQKIKKKTETLQIELAKTTDILKYFGSKKKPNQFIAGFALETENELNHATQKLIDKNADCIILNSLNEAAAGFEKETNKISIINKKEKINYEAKLKKEVASDIVDYILTQI
jgi:phosphopantothenoylcysteine decarboxylase/phosphopantothenate--cysteine ligase